MQIEEGKFYKSREGKKIGPIQRRATIGLTYPWTDGAENYRGDGTWAIEHGVTNHRDLIEEWREPATHRSPDMADAFAMAFTAHLTPVPSVVPGYAALAEVLSDAYNHAASGKGHQRHAGDRPFLDQPIIEIGRMIDSIGGHAYQITKKAQEGNRMAGRADYAAAIGEMLGIINYAAAAVILLREFEQEDFVEVDTPAK